MKKNYFLAIIFAFGMLSVNAQFVDDMESYGGGDTPILEGHWGSWDGTAATAMFSSGAQAQSGALSGYVDGSGIDPLLLLGNKIFGAWGLKFAMYIPTGKIGYWNIQGDEAPGIQWVVGNITFGNGVASDDDATGRIDWSTADEADDAVFPFPKDVWFDVIMNFNIEAGTGVATWTMWVDGLEVVAPGTPFADKADPPVYAQALGGLNLFSTGADMEMYVDDFDYRNEYFPPPTAGIADLKAKGFAAYPNPVNNILNLRANEAITSVAIYNVLGQQVYSAQVDALNTTIDMSRFDNGAYFVKAVIGTTEGTVKVLK